MAKRPSVHPLRAYRIAHGLSSKDLAKRLAIAESTLRSFENGNRKIKPEMAVDFEARIGIDRAELNSLFERAAA